MVQDVSGLGVRCYAVPRRYAAAPLAEQLIGYLDSEGHGAAGLEAALDDVLYTGERDTLHCAVTAQGRLQRGSEPILEKADSAPQGVRLTLSRSIQRAAEGVAAESMATGCILITDVSSGKVRACVSLPDFDAANVGESLTAPDSPLLNRAFSAYAVGSVLKPVLAAAALEAREGDFIRECPGYDALNGQVYRCAGSVPHGLVGLDGALEKSCNGYFIELGRELGPERVRQMAAALGFGKGQDIADGLRSASGVLPEAETLENEGQFANFCFGQGELLATPLQVAGMMNTIAAGGVYHTPLFVECTVDETTGEELTPLAHRSSRRVFAEQTAGKLQELLAGVVAEGTGRQAAPSEGTAAGKTGTAQTGQFRDGEELKNYWFAGFYPAEKPRWTIVVMQAAQTEPEVSSAAIFARLLSDKLDERIPSGNNVKFKDIAPDMWYAGYVEYLTGYGVAVGYNDRTYRGDKAITRAEFTAMAARFFDVFGDGDEAIMEQYQGFDDVNDGYWAAEYIKDAAIHGWVEGYGDGTFRADDPIDRAEVVTIVNRLLGREADEDYIADNYRRLVTFPDVSSRHWAYYQVLEAANAHTAVLTDPETWDK